MWPAWKMQGKFWKMLGLDRCFFLKIRSILLVGHTVFVSLHYILDDQKVHVSWGYVDKSLLNVGVSSDC